MANFPTHVTTSAILGAAYGTAAHVAYGYPLPSCLLAGGLCTIAGILPDVDSDNAVVLREILAFVAAVIPMLLLDRFREMMWPQESIVVAVGLMYVVIRFGIGEVIRKVTIHRGMWHSIPAAVIVSLVIYVLCDCTDPRLRIFKTLAVFLGYVWHLVLDEIYAVDTGQGRVRVKRSFGTALKLFGPNPVANVAVYAQLLAVTYFLMSQPPLEPATYPHVAGDSQVAGEASPGPPSPAEPSFSHGHDDSVSPPYPPQLTPVPPPTGSSR